MNMRIQFHSSFSGGGFVFVLQCFMQFWIQTSCWTWEPSFCPLFLGKDSYLFYRVSCNSGSKLLVEYEDPVSVFFFWGGFVFVLQCFMQFWIQTSCWTWGSSFCLLFRGRIRIHILGRWNLKIWIVQSTRSNFLFEALRQAPSLQKRVLIISSCYSCIAQICFHVSGV